MRHAAGRGCCWAQIPLLHLRLPYETYIWHCGSAVAFLFPLPIPGLHFSSASCFKPEFDWLGIVGRLFMRPSVYLLDWYQICGVAMSWDFSHGSFQPYWSFFFFFFECLQSDSPLYHIKRGARIWICRGLRKAKTPITLRAWTSEDILGPCPLPSPAARQPLSTSGTLLWRMYLHIPEAACGEHGLLACKAHLVSDACQQ